MIELPERKKKKVNRTEDVSVNLILRVNATQSLQLLPSCFLIRTSLTSSCQCVSLYVYFFHSLCYLSCFLFPPFLSSSLAIITRVYPRLSYILPSCLLPFFLIFHSRLSSHVILFFLLALPLFVLLSLTYCPTFLPPKGAVALVRVSLDMPKEKQFGDETRGRETLYTP